MSNFSISKTWHENKKFFHIFRKVKMPSQNKTKRKGEESINTDRPEIETKQDKR